jgi:hypothetical protein
MFYPKGRLSDMGRVSAAVLILFISIGSAFSEGLEFGINTAGLSTDEISFYLFDDYNNPTGMNVFFAKNEIGPTELYRGMYLWSASDRRLAELQSILPENGRIICEEGYAPRWIVGWCAGVHASSACGASNRRPANVEAQAYLAEYYSALVSRYKPGGSLASRSDGVSSWGIWNEPDGVGIMCCTEMSGRSQHEPNAVGLIAYFSVARLAASSIRDADPTSEIVSGGFLSPSSGDPSHFWQDPAAVNFQLMFAGYQGRAAVQFGWPDAPDALHWHPYDEMLLDSEDSEEWWYDPLVLDPDDFMYEHRATELASGFMASLFIGNLQPVWSEMPQYLLEYCPAYSLNEWREDRSGSDHAWPTSSEYFTLWRANYFITSNLLLAQSDNVRVLAPQMPWGGEANWWTGWKDSQDIYDWRPVRYEGEQPYMGDVAFRFQSSLLSGMHYTPPDPNAVSINDHTSARLWRFSSASGEETVHAFRTFRSSIYDTEYNPETYYQIPVIPSAGAGYLDVYSMTGEFIERVSTSIDPVEVTANGYVRYAVEIIEEDSASAARVREDIRFIVRRSGDDLVVLAPSNSCVAVFDMSGRIVDTVETGELLSDGLIRLSCSTAGWPSACYLVQISSAAGETIGCEKVTVLR